MDRCTCPQPNGRHDGNKQVKRPEKLSSYKKTGALKAWKSRFVFAAFLVAVVLFSPLLQARQNSARINLQKTVEKSPERIHVVKKGESLLSIIKTIPIRKPGALALVKRLNPSLRNVNMIHPGQKIVLPAYENQEDPVANPPVKKRVEDKPVPYLIKENDSISMIILAELRAGFNGRELPPEETIAAYRRIRILNPDIEDMSNLPAGRTLLLPPQGPDLPVAGPGQTNQEPLPAINTDKKEPDTKKKEENTKTHPALYALLTSIRPVIERMNGSVNATGSYFIPLPENSRMNIDSSLIPSVELDDGTVVFLDYENRLNDGIRQLVRQYWQNYFFLTNMDLQNVPGALQGIIGHSRNYTIASVEKPFMLSSQPEIAVFPDWIITGNKKTPGASYRQGIFLPTPDKLSIPEAARLFLEQCGLAVTQISPEKISAYNAENLAKIQIIRDDLRNLRGIALADRLLTSLGEKLIRRTPVGIFSKDINGFDLSITAEILLSKGERKLIINSKKLPEQFVKILKSAGFELLTIGENDRGRSLIESVLRGAGLPASFGYYSLRVPKEGKISRLNISFSALNSLIETGQVYLVDFDMADWFLPLMFSGPRALVIRY
jgi:hypothetical protein